MKVALLIVAVAFGAVVLILYRRPWEAGSLDDLDAVTIDRAVGS